MNLQKLTYASAVMGVAALLMIVMAPVSASTTSAIEVTLDKALGSGWKVLPIFTIVPWVITYAFYAIGIMLFLICSNDNAPYPPVDEKGRPMIACFGRHTPFRWVRRTDTE